MEKNYLVKLGKVFINDSYELELDFRNIMREYEIFLLDEKVAFKLAKEVGGKVFKLGLQEVESVKK